MTTSSPAQTDNNTGCPPWCDGSHEIRGDGDAFAHSTTRLVDSSTRYPIEVRLSQWPHEDGPTINVGGEAYITPSVYNNQVTQLVDAIHELERLYVATLTPARTCPVSWCTSDHFRGDPDHCVAALGGADWPDVPATADPCEMVPGVGVGPNWIVSEGLDPAVVLYLTSSNKGDVEATLRPDEARRAAEHLVRAAEAAEGTHR